MSIVLSAWSLPSSSSAGESRAPLPRTDGFVLVPFMCLELEIFSESPPWTACGSAAPRGSVKDKRGRVWDQWARGESRGTAASKILCHCWAGFDSSVPVNPNPLHTPLSTLLSMLLLSIKTLLPLWFQPCFRHGHDAHSACSEYLWALL